MISSVNELVEKARGLKSGTIAVAVAQDDVVIKAIAAAREKDIAEAVLVGDSDEIKRIAEGIGVDISSFEIVDAKDKHEAARKAVELVSCGRANLLMKGFIDSASFLRAVLDKEQGLRSGRLMSHAGVFEVPHLGRLIFLTDAAFNIAPSLQEKSQIIANAVGLARAVGIDVPKVAALCALELVNPDMPATLDAAALAKMCDRGQIKNCVVDGPLAMDNILSQEAAKHKGVGGPVAGRADIILAPNIETGNAVYKTLTFAGRFRSGGILLGASVPVIMTSRADNFDTRIFSIALAAFTANFKG